MFGANHPGGPAAQACGQGVDAFRIGEETRTEGFDHVLAGVEMGAHAQDGLGEAGGVRIRCGALQVQADELLEAGIEGDHVGVGVFYQRTAGLDHFPVVNAHHQPDAFALLEGRHEHHEHLVQHGFEGLREIQAGGAVGGLDHAAVGVAAGAIDGGFVEVGLVAKVVGDGAQIHACGFGNLTGGGFLVAVGGEQAQCGIQQALARLGAVGAGGNVGNVGGGIHNASRSTDQDKLVG